MTRTVQQLLDLRGRAALVTGGAGHIGMAISEALVELGVKVAIMDKEASACVRSVKTLSELGPGDAIPLPCDVADETLLRSTLKRGVGLLGGLDILVHCAAFVGTTKVAGWAVPFEEQTVQAWDAALRVNLTSAFTMMQETREALAASGHGSVIFFASIYGVSGPDMRLYEGTDMANPAGYAASKGGLIQLTRYFATLLAPRIRVNAISPGGVWRNQPEAFHRRYVSRVPLGRMATEEDLKGAVAYLASDLSAYVTGHNLLVDGGWTVW